MSSAILTVLMPTYNRESTIAQAIDSVLMQKTQFEFELIIIDDKSTDRSLKIAQHYQQRYPQKIKILTHAKNQGCLSATLKGYEHTKTEYFCVLDPDDYWISENKLQNAVDFLEANRNFTLYISNTYLEENKTRTPYFTLSKKETFEFKTLHKAIYGHTSGVVFRNVIFKHGVPKELYSHIGTKNERHFEGDSFRNLVHLSKGKAHCVNDIESVYRITSDGIWTRCNKFQQNILNAGFFLSMFTYFGHTQPDFFLDKCFNFLKLNFALLDEPHVNKDLSDFCTVLAEYLKHHRSFFANTHTLNNPIIFYMPSRIVGGYEFFFMKLASFLANKLELNVHYIDYDDGFVKKQLSETQTNVKFLTHSNNNSQLDLNNPVNLIAPITLLSEIPTLNHPHSKPLFWCAHPRSLTWLEHRSGLPNKQLTYFLNKASAADSVCFMDWACWDSSKSTSRTHFKEVYLPVFTDEKASVPLNDTIALVHETDINIGWLGRLDSDKIFSLINVLDNFYYLNSGEKKKNIHIIGDGDSKHLIDVKKYADKINLIFKSTLINHTLYQYLLENVDVLFSMGISSLEAASLKIPSVLTCLTDRSTNTDIFLWVFNSKKYTLGYGSEQLNRADLQTISFGQIIDEIYIQNIKKQRGLESYDYFTKNHHIESVVVKLIKIILNANHPGLLQTSGYSKILNKFYMRPMRFARRLLAFCKRKYRGYRT